MLCWRPTSAASYLCGVLLLAKKCDWRPTRVQEYLSILCDSGTATLRVPQEKLDVVRTLLTEALENRTVAFKTLQRIAGKVTRMTVAIRPASLYTQAMFAALVSYAGENHPAHSGSVPRLER